MHSFTGALSRLLVVLILAAMPAVAQASQRIITGCDKGAREAHTQSFPQEALGQIPNKILNWEIGLARGVYSIRIASWHDFTPLIYIKNRQGKYVGSGVNTSTTRKRSPKNGKYYYEKVFTANHNNDVWNNFWLLQIKPKIKTSIKRSRWPSSTSNAQRAPAPAVTAHPAHTRIRI